MFIDDNAFSRRSPSMFGVIHFHIVVGSARGSVFLCEI